MCISLYIISLGVISQDGFGQLWSHDLLTEIIEEEVTKHDIHTVWLGSYSVVKDTHQDVT